MSMPTAVQHDDEPKRTYATPRLTAHGTLQDITRQAGWQFGPTGRGMKMRPIDPLLEDAMSPLTS